MKSKSRNAVSKVEETPTAAATERELTGSAKPYEPTAEERRVLEAQRARRRQQGPQVHMKAANKQKGQMSILPDHPDGAYGQLLLMEALGTTRLDFVDGLLGQLANAASKGQTVDERQLNFMLDMVAGIEPRDQLEAMLAAQMAAVHNATMTFARRLNHVDNIQQQDSAARAFNKLARTFAAQVEALQRYRGKGQQRVTVEHVHVHQGGQAIVGAVQGGGEPRKSEEQPDAIAITHEPGQSLPSEIQTVREAVPSTGG